MNTYYTQLHKTQVHAAQTFINCMLVKPSTNFPPHFPPNFPHFPVFFCKHLTQYPPPPPLCTQNMFFVLLSQS